MALHGNLRKKTSNVFNCTVFIFWDITLAVTGKLWAPGGEIVSLPDILPREYHPAGAGIKGREWSRMSEKSCRKQLGQPKEKQSTTGQGSLLSSSESVYWSQAAVAKLTFVVIGADQ